MTTKALESLASFVLLPDLRLLKVTPLKRWGIKYVVEKTSRFEVCPHCARKCHRVKDRRLCRVQDEPVRGKAVYLYIHKRRFFCKPCGRVFLEPVPGIAKYAKFTKRFEKGLSWASTKFSSLSDVQKNYRCSAGKCFKAAYSAMETRLKANQYPCPKQMGIDEHSLKKPKYEATQYSTILVDHVNEKVYDLIDGRAKADLDQAFGKMTGKENVELFTMDMSTTFRSAVRRHFPNADIEVDRFHVERLFNRALNKERKKTTGDKRKNPIRKLLLRKAKRLLPEERRAMNFWLNTQPKARELHEYKEAIGRFYETKAPSVAQKIFDNLRIKLKASKLDAAKALSKTLGAWRKEILAYHKWRMTNARCEGFNRVAKLIQREGFGYRSFENYRNKFLNRCKARAA
jgi:transposase